MADTDFYKALKQISWSAETIRLLGFAIPLLITFFIFLGKMNTEIEVLKQTVPTNESVKVIETRLSVLERTVPTSNEMIQAVKTGVSEAMGPIVDQLRDHELRLRDMEKK